MRGRVVWVVVENWYNASFLVVKCEELGSLKGVIGGVISKPNFFHNPLSAIKYGWGVVWCDQDQLQLNKHRVVTAVSPSMIRYKHEWKNCKKTKHFKALSFLSKWKNELKDCFTLRKVWIGGLFSCLLANAQTICWKVASSEKMLEIVKKILNTFEVKIRASWEQVKPGFTNYQPRDLLFSQIKFKR